MVDAGAGAGTGDGAIIEMPIKVMAHQAILAAQCVYFRRLFAAGSADRSTSTPAAVVKLPAQFKSENALRGVLQYLYTGEVDTLTVLLASGDEPHQQQPGEVVTQASNDSKQEQLLALVSEMLCLAHYFNVSGLHSQI